jgi:hypothetical protein
VEAALRLEGGREPRDEAAGLVFGWRNPTNFHFFGISGSRSAWVIGACRDGRVAHLAARGAPLRADAWQRLTVARAEDGTVEGRAGEEVVCRWKPPGDEWTGTAGLYAGSRPAFFRRPLRRIGPADEGWVARGARLEGPDARARPVVRASDGFAAAEREAP